MRLALKHLKNSRNHRCLEFNDGLEKEGEHQLAAVILVELMGNCSRLGWYLHTSTYFSFDGDAVFDMACDHHVATIREIRVRSRI